MKRSSLSLRAVGCLGLLGCVGAVSAQDRASLPHPVYGLGMPVSVEGLAAVRGGFDLGDGLQVSFGIQRAVYVDGNLVTYVNVSVPDIAHITQQQATSLATALGTLNVQVGQGNTFNPSSSTTQPGALSSVSSHVPTDSPTTQANATTIVQNALSNPLVTSTIIPASAQANAATVIQNTVDNQIISSLTTLNVAINAMHNQGLQQSLQAAQWQGLTH